MHQSFVIIWNHVPPPGDSRENEPCSYHPAVPTLPGKCGVFVFALKKAGDLPSDCHCVAGEFIISWLSQWGRDFTRDWLGLKSKSLLFPGGGGVVTNDWCIISLSKLQYIYVKPVHAGIEIIYLQSMFSEHHFSWWKHYLNAMNGKVLMVSKFMCVCCAEGPCQGSKEWSLI